MNAACVTRNSAYACWLSRDFNDQCEDIRLDGGPVAFWSDSSLLMRFAIPRGLKGTQVSRCSTNDFILAKVLGSLWHGSYLMSGIFNAGHCIYYHFTSIMCKVYRYLLYLMICCHDAKHPIPVNVYFITVLVTRVLCLQLGVFQNQRKAVLLLRKEHNVTGASCLWKTTFSKFTFTEGWPWTVFWNIF
jgi:hypothetical protein